MSTNRCAVSTMSVPLARLEARGSHRRPRRRRPRIYRGQRRIRGVVQRDGLRHEHLRRRHDVGNRRALGGVALVRQQTGVHRRGPRTVRCTLQHRAALPARNYPRRVCRRHEQHRHRPLGRFRNNEGRDEVRKHLCLVYDRPRRSDRGRHGVLRQHLLQRALGEGVARYTMTATTEGG